ncbi:MAG TPA: O-methyltransferase [Rhizomicrobium sp.]|nr:O-methyltransferase [Rhizomicrobium sp.]
MSKTWDAVDEYYAKAFGASDPVLKKILAASKKAGLPDIQVSPLQGRLLMLLAQSMGAKRILEVGTLGGYSSIWMARALPKDGVLVSLEYEPLHAKVAAANIAMAGFAGQVQVRQGAGADSMAALVKEKTAPFDFVFIDADKPGYPTYLEWALKLTRPGSLIVADNMVRQGKVADAQSRDAAVQGVRKFNALVAKNPRLEATAVQTVGSKGYDGFVLARVIS